MSAVLLSGLASCSAPPEPSYLYTAGNLGMNKPIAFLRDAFGEPDKTEKDGILYITKWNHSYEKRFTFMLPTTVKTETYYSELSNTATSYSTINHGLNTSDTITFFYHITAFYKNGKLWTWYYHKNMSDERIINSSWIKKHGYLAEWLNDHKYASVKTIRNWYTRVPSLRKDEYYRMGALEAVRHDQADLVEYYIKECGVSPDLKIESWIYQDDGDQFTRYQTCTITLREAAKLMNAPKTAVRIERLSPQQRT